MNVKGKDIFENFMFAISQKGSIKASIKNGELRSEIDGSSASILFLISYLLNNMAKKSFMKNEKIKNILDNKLSSIPNNEKEAARMMTFIDLLLDEIRDLCIVLIAKEETDRLMENCDPAQLAILNELLKMDKKDLDEIKKKLNL